MGAAAFGQLPLIVGDTKPDYVRLVQLLEGQVMVCGRGRAYQNPLDMQITIDAIRRLRDAPPPAPAVAVRLLAGLELPTVVDASEAVELVCAKRRAMEREFLSDARGRRHTMVAGLCNIRRGEPLSDVEDAVLAAALAELDEKYVGEPTLSDLVQVIEDRPLRLQDAAYDEGSEQRYRETVRGLIRTIRSMLAPHGEMGDLFAHRTTTRIDIEGPACFDTSSIPEDQTKLVAAALMACWQQGFAAVNTRVALGLAGVMAMKHYNVVVDETWRVMLAARSGMVDRINALTRLNRQIGCSLMMAYHTIRDLQSMAEEHERTKALGFIQRSGMLLIGGLPPEEFDRLRQVREFSDKELRYLLAWQDAAPLNHAGQGEPPGPRQVPAQARVAAGDPAADRAHARRASRADPRNLDRLEGALTMSRHTSRHGTGPGSPDTAIAVSVARGVRRGCGRRRRRSPRRQAGHDRAAVMEPAGRRDPARQRQATGPARGDVHRPGAAARGRARRTARRQPVAAPAARRCERERRPGRAADGQPPAAAAADREERRQGR